MNIPTKVMRSAFMTFETYYHHQQLAKKYYKTSNKTTKKQKNEITKDSKLCENYLQQESQFNFIEQKQQCTYNYKEDILKW
jgi:hypothetical protein